MRFPPVRSRDCMRLVIVASGMFFLFSILIVQFFRIQVIEGEKWTRVAQGQHYFVITEPFVRGTFFSNTGLKKGHPEAPQPFAMDIQKFHLYVDPQSVPAEHRNDIVDALARLLGKVGDARGDLEDQFFLKSRSRKLAMWLDEEARARIQEWWLPYAREHHIAPNALYFVTDYQRSYPFGKMLGQVLHTIQSNKDEITKQGVPTGGLELQLNKYLKGKLGKRLLMRSPRNSLETGEVIQAPENGADVYLTVNHYLQGIAEEEVEKGVKNCKAKSGWAVMMDPRTGEILALAQYPSFYPANYHEYFNDPGKASDAVVKAVTDANEPGSTLKPFTIATALLANKVLRNKGEKELFSITEKIASDNGFFPGRGSKPITDTHKHSFLNMYMAMQKSSNIYMGRVIDRVINKLGAPFYRDMLYSVYGFGRKTGLELPAESAGVLPTPGKTHPNGALEWSVPTPYSLAIGHNIQVTSLQMVRAYAILANGGYLVTPTLVRQIVKKHPDGSQEVLVDNTSEERIRNFPRVMDEETVKTVVTAMRYVTKTGGTSRRADISGYTEIGKSSSARKIINGQYSTQHTFCTFAGIAPVENPAFVLLVAMDEPEPKIIPGVGPNNHGGVCAAPVFKEIATRALQYLGVTPDDPYGYPTTDPRYDPDKAVWMKEVRELSELYKEWNGH